MNEGIYLSYDVIASIIIVILVAIIGWFIIYFSKLNKKIDKLEIQNSALKTAQDIIMKGLEVKIKGVKK